VQYSSGVTDEPAGDDQRRARENAWRRRWIERKRVEMGEEAFAQYWRELNRKKPETARRQRRRYAQRVAARTGDGAHARGSKWTIDDARTVLDLALSVPEAALRVGRTASAVAALRQRWRSGRLPAALQDHLSTYPGKGQ
jgi:hypothetical protein